MLLFIGELMVYCDGPDSDKPAECQLTDHAVNSGQSVVTITAHSAGLHSLHVRYNDVNVPGTVKETIFEETIYTDVLQRLATFRVVRQASLARTYDVFLFARWRHACKKSRFPL